MNSKEWVRQLKMRDLLMYIKEVLGQVKCLKKYKYVDTEQEDSIYTMVSSM